MGGHDKKRLAGERREAGRLIRHGDGSAGNVNHLVWQLWLATPNELRQRLFAPCNEIIEMR
jgi:hypothetical protein